MGGISRLCCNMKKASPETRPVISNHPASAKGHDEDEKSFEGFIEFLVLLLVVALRKKPTTPLTNPPPPAANSSEKGKRKKHRHGGSNPAAAAANSCEKGLVGRNHEDGKSRNGFIDFLFESFNIVALRKKHHAANSFEKPKKKVSFRTPEVTDVFIFCSEDYNSS